MMTTMTAQTSSLFDESYYCQRDPFWREVQTLKRGGNSQDDMFMHIFDAYRGAGALTCAGDVLAGLLRLAPYPVRVLSPRSKDDALRAPSTNNEGRCVHPGPATCFSVHPLPSLAQAKLPDDASADFCALVDQCLLGAGWFDGTAFPALEDVDEVPWRRLSEAAQHPQALSVLRDWGTIVRMALAGLKVEDASPMQLQRRYERAMLRWLVQRFAFDELHLCVSDDDDEEAAPEPALLLSECAMS
jgi:hypothetical protein